MTAVLTWLLYPFIYGAALTVVLYGVGIMVPQATFVARLVASYLCLIVCAAYGVVAALVLRPFNGHHSAQHATARAFQFLMKYATGVTVSVDDPHNYLGRVRPGVFVGPHQTELDILILGAVFPRHCSVTAKASLKRVPVLGWFMALSGTVFINRSNSKSAREAMQGAADEMRRRGQSVWMFPEGTRSYAAEPGLLPFKKGAFHLAVQAKVPVVPVVVANYADILDVKKWRFNAGVVRIKVLKPIETTNLTTADVEDLTRDTREKMLDTMVELTALQRGHPVKRDEKLGGNGVVKASGVEATSAILS